MPVKEWLYFFKLPQKNGLCPALWKRGGNEYVWFTNYAVCVWLGSGWLVWDESISIQQYFEWGHECGLEGTVESEWSLVSVSEASISFSWIRVSKVTHVRMSRSLMGSRRGSFRYHGANHNQIHCCLVQRPFEWFSDWNDVCFKLNKESVPAFSKELLNGRWAILETLD